MKLICIANQKGGVGKTTTVINLARSITLLGKNVLIIDLDPQGNALIALQNFLSHQKSNYYFESKEKNLSLLSFPKLMEHVGKKDPNVVLLKEEIEKINGKFELVLLDSPPRIDSWGIAGLELADNVLIPVQCEFFAMQGLAQMLQIIEGIKATRNPKISVIGFLLTMVNLFEEHHREVISEIKTHFKNKVFFVEIPRDIKLAEATSFGKPCYDYDASSPGVLAYIELAKEVINNETRKETWKRS